MFDPVMFQNLSNILVNKRSVIIINYFVRYAKPCDNVLTDEITNGRTDCFAKGNDLSPLQKVLNSYQDPNVSTGRINRANKCGRAMVLPCFVDWLGVCGSD